MWADSVERIFEGAHLWPRHDRGVLRVEAHGEAALLELSAAPHAVVLREPTRALASSWAVLVQREGEGTLRSDTARGALLPGTVCFLSPRECFELELSRYREQIVVVPRTWLSLDRALSMRRAGDARSVVLGAILAAPPPARLAPWLRLSASEDSLLVRALEHVPDHLEACPREIASALGVSRRTLDLRLSAIGLTTEQLRWELRLLEAHRRLVRTEARCLEIAIATGFRTEAHFSRSIRRRFGRSPRAVRHGSHA
jgi:AraC-like DNA-binding protein